MTAPGGLVLNDPWLLLPGLLVLVVAAWRAARGAPAVVFAPGGFLGRRRTKLPRSLRVRLLPLPPLLTVAGLLLVVFAAARPVRHVPVPRTTEGIDILLAIDTSSSMAELDLSPDRTRLAVVKEAAEIFVTGRPDDRIGLITFARYPDLRCPPTLDHEALLAALRAVTLVESEGPEDATGIGAAVARAADALRGSEADSRVVILLTDGEENVATAEEPDEIPPLHAGQLCVREGVRVFSVAAGLGTRGPGGAWSPLDTGAVRDLAARTGGRFYQARDAGAVEGVYAEIDGLTRAEFREPRFETREAFLSFLFLAFALLLAGRLLAAGPLGVRP